MCVAEYIKLTEAWICQSFLSPIFLHLFIQNNGCLSKGFLRPGWRKFYPLILRGDECYMARLILIQVTWLTQPFKSEAFLSGFQMISHHRCLIYNQRHLWTIQPLNHLPTDWLLTIQIQWGSEIWTSLDFKWTFWQMVTLTLCFEVCGWPSKSFFFVWKYFLGCFKCFIFWNIWNKVFFKIFLCL